MWLIKKLFLSSPRYKDLLKIVAAPENNEKLVDVRTFDASIIAEYEKQEMQPYTGELIFVRQEVAKRLAMAQQLLRKRYGYGLRVVYGYRHPDVQKLYFKKRREILSKSMPKLSGDDLDEATHVFVAVPLVAGHPTGGAIDLTLVNKNNTPLDMGTGIADFSDTQKIKTFATGLTAKVRKNREILIDAMLKVGFAPFYGEWWHFSYGDREWAWQTSKKQAIYSSIDFKNT